jgi:hypothetical protein
VAPPPTIASWHEGCKDRDPGSVGKGWTYRSGFGGDGNRCASARRAEHGDVEVECLAEATIPGRAPPRAGVRSSSACKESGGGPFVKGRNHHRHASTGGPACSPASAAAVETGRGTALEARCFYVWDEDRRTAVGWASELAAAASPSAQGVERDLAPRAMLESLADRSKGVFPAALSIEREE